MRGIRGALALVLSTGLAACVFDGESSPIDGRLRESCPENPFETRIEPDSGLWLPGIHIIGPVDSNGLDVEISVYDDRETWFWENRILHEELNLSAEAVETLPKDSSGNRWLRVLMSMRDKEGDFFPSGYYFIFITANDESIAAPYSGCFFYVNPKDVDKVKKLAASS